MRSFAIRNDGEEERMSLVQSQRIRSRIIVTGAKIEPEQGGTSFFRRLSIGGSLARHGVDGA